jgi:uncharacterized protein YjiS (DUF1127 family)
MTIPPILALWSRGSARWRLLSLPGRIASIARSRRDLLRLDDRLLGDIGLTRHEAEAEASRAPWDPPLHWRD